RTERQHRIPADLELLWDAVVEARIRVVRTREEEDADAILGLDGLEDGAALLFEVLLEDGERLPALAAGVIVLVLCDAEARAPGLEKALRHEVRLDERDGGIDELDAACGEEVDLLREG